jgi:hypothetical protein
LSIFISSFEKCLFSSIAYLLFGILALLVFNFLDHLNILDINSLLDDYLTKIFFHSIGCLLILLIVSFAGQKLFYLIQCHLLMLAFTYCNISPMFSSNSFKVSGLTLRSLIHFELNFVQGKK